MLELLYLDSQTRKEQRKENSFIHKIWISSGAHQEQEFRKRKKDPIQEIEYKKNILLL